MTVPFAGFFLNSNTFLVPPVMSDDDIVRLFTSLHNQVCAAAANSSFQMVHKIKDAGLPGLHEESMISCFDEYLDHRIKIQQYEIAQYYRSFIRGRGDVTGLANYYVVKLEQIDAFFQQMVAEVFNHVEKLYMKNYALMNEAQKKLITSLRQGDVNDQSLKDGLKIILNDLDSVINGKVVLIDKLRTLGVSNRRLTKIERFLFSDTNYVGIMYKGLRDDIAQAVEASAKEMPSYI